MKKFISFLKKKDIDVIIIICLIVAQATLFLKMNCYDELWNFANCYKMFEGYKIYRDLNVIITPLFFYTAQLFFKLFGATILSFKMYNICISSILLIIIYKIFKQLRIVRRRAIIYTLLIALMIIEVIKVGANYNLFVFVPILLQILISLKRKENDVISGILLFLTFMLKQNVFVILAMGLFIYKGSTNKEIKDIIISLTKIYLTSLICIGLFIIYLYLDNNLHNFINYCFLGLAEFKNKNVIGGILDLKYIYISILSAFFLLFIIYNKNIKVRLDENTIKNIKIFLCFGIPLIFIAYPIFNYYHSTVASLVLIIGAIYTLEELMLKELLKHIKNEKNIYIIMILFWIIYCIYSITYIALAINHEAYYFEKEHPFFGYIADEKDLNDIEIVCSYIREQKRNAIDVKILSCKANIYMVPLGINNGIFDLPNLGNFGKNGEEELLNQVKRLNNSVILLETQKNSSFVDQESKKVREYIIKTYKKIGEIQEYSIYEIK